MRKFTCVVFIFFLCLCLAEVQAQSAELIHGSQQLLVKFQQGELSEMLNLADQMAKLSEKEFGANDPDHALLVFILAIAQQDQGKLNESEVNLKKSLNILRTSNNLLPHQKQYLGYVYLGFGRLYNQKGAYGKAEQFLLESAKTLEKSAGKDAVYALPINDLGNFYKDQGDYARAEKYLYESAEIRRKTLGEKHFNYGVSLNNLASLYEQMGNYTAAALYYEDSYSIWSQSLGETHPLIATAFNNYAGLFVKVGTYDQAEKFYTKALEICKKVYGEHHANYTSTLSNLANVYRLMRMPDKAEFYAGRCLQLRRENGGEQHLDYGFALNNLGLAKMDLGKLEEAEKLLAAALVIFKNSLGKNHRNVAVCANNLGVINVKMSRPEQAAAFLKESLGIALDRIDFVFPAMSDKEKALFYNTLQTNFEYFNYFAAQNYRQTRGLAADMYNYTIATKALLLNVSNKIKKRILASSDATLIDLYNEWKDKKNMLARVWQMSAAEKAKIQVDEKALESEITNLEKSLSSSSELFASQADNKRYTWKDIQKKLLPGEAAVEIVRFRTHGFEFTDTAFYAALIVKPGISEPDMVLFDQGNFMETKLVTLYKNSIVHGLPDTKSYQGFWQPIAEKLGNIGKVYLSPDGVYNQINIQSLYNTSTKKFLIDEIAVQLVTNSKDIMALPQKPQLRNAVMLGFPDYKYLPDKIESSVNDTNEHLPDSLKREIQNLISPLPGTLSEVNVIGAIFQKKNIETRIVTGGDANEAFLKTVESPSVLHIATHGFFLPDVDPKAEQASGSYMGLDAERIAENPLLRSGILLAGAQHSASGKSTGKEDGILSAYEAMNLNLEKTQLVVLSACETGLGEVRNGEGVYGFQRALIIAGTRTVIMSLWKVNDEVTQKLMASFYKFWMDGQSKRQAFISAQNAIRNEHPHPYYWAPFILIGD